MHELGITRSIVAIVCEQARGAKVLRVTLEIGKLSAVMPDAVRFCFDVCARGTPAEGAELEIIEVPGRAICRGCGGEMALAEPYGRCLCGSSSLELIAGEELKIKEMEVAECA
ncbi:MAG: hydrogenase maturation nickel metallochaperone HypA [Azospira oryzae]|nr:MAG: hydrogenase maturation nickel metallochaperone HypA [Azospira oryzae]PZP78211.1 MAG: hydrogenase maturation nickel metallochaperone HypA [Azospira oryzae]